MLQVSTRYGEGNKTVPIFEKMATYFKRYVGIENKPLTRRCYGYNLSSKYNVIAESWWNNIDEFEEDQEFTIIAKTGELALIAPVGAPVDYSIKWFFLLDHIAVKR